MSTKCKNTCQHLTVHSLSSRLPTRPPTAVFERPDPSHTGPYYWRWIRVMGGYMVGLEPPQLPHSVPGQILELLASAFGVCLLAVLIAVISQKLELRTAEARVVEYLNNDIKSQRTTRAAIVLVQQVWRAYALKRRRARERARRAGDSHPRDHEWARGGIRVGGVPGDGCRTGGGRYGINGGSGGDNRYREGGGDMYVSGFQRFFCCCNRRRTLGSVFPHKVSPRIQAFVHAAFRRAFALRSTLYESMTNGEPSTHTPC